MRIVMFLFILLGAALNGFTDITENWDDPAAGLAGWDKASINTTLEYKGENTVCDQGGCISAVAASTCGFRAPANFSGDLPAKGYNCFSFGLRVLLQQLTAFKPVVTFRYSPSYNGWEYKPADFVVDASSWQTFNVYFDPAWSDAEAVAHGWKSLGSPNKSFSETVSHAALVYIKYDYAANVPVAFAIDNVSLSYVDPIPQPPVEEVVEETADDAAEDTSSSQGQSQGSSQTTTVSGTSSQKTGNFTTNLMKRKVVPLRRR